MTVHKIKTDYNTHYDISASNDTWIFERGITVFATASHGIYVDAVYSGSDIRLFGNAFGALDGVFAAGRSTSILIGETGNATGFQDGVSITGNLGRLVNHGYITGSGNGVTLSGVSASVANDGFIHGDDYAIHAENGTYKIDSNGTLTAPTDIYATNCDLTLTLGADSEIVASNSTAIIIVATAANTTRIVNHGIIRGYGYAYSGGEGSDHLTNTGFIHGLIELKGGDDIIDVRMGYLDGVIYGGAGDDTFLVSSQKTALSELSLEGEDTVKSTVSYTLADNFENLVLLGAKTADGTGNTAANSLIGNSAANLLQGKAGIDEITGGGGNDRLIGGAGADTFVFKGHFGHDTIKDFVAGSDRIDLSAIGDIAGFSDLMHHHTTETGGTVKITDGSDVIIIAHAHKTDLHAGDFIV